MGNEGYTLSRKLHENLPRNLKSEEFVAKKQIGQDNLEWWIVYASKEGSYYSQSTIDSNAGCTEDAFLRCKRVSRWDNSSGASHVPSPLTVPSPRGMPSLDSGLPHDTRNVLGTSGNVSESPAREGPPSALFENSNSWWLSLASARWRWKWFVPISGRKTHGCRQSFCAVREKSRVKDIKIPIRDPTVVAWFWCTATLAKKWGCTSNDWWVGTEEKQLIPVYIEDHIFNFYLSKEVKSTETHIVNISLQPGNECGIAVRSLVERNSEHWFGASWWWHWTYWSATWRCRNEERWRWRVIGSGGSQSKNESLQ